MKKLVVYVSHDGGMMRQYRISPPNPDNRVSDSDGWRFGATLTEKVNFALSEALTDRREAIRKAIGGTGLTFISKLANRIKLFDTEQLIIVNGWTIIYLAKGASDPLRDDVWGHHLDRKMTAAISNTLRCKVEMIPAEEPVGAVFL